MLQAVDHLHNTSKMTHNGLSLSQILFDRTGNIKINLGINQIFKDKVETTSLASEKLSLYEASEINNPAFFKKMSSEQDLDELRA